MEEAGGSGPPPGWQERFRRAPHRRPWKKAIVGLAMKDSFGGAPERVRFFSRSDLRAAVLIPAALLLWGWVAPAWCPAAEVKGIVLNPDGTPAEGAIVWSVPFFPDRIVTNETAAGADGRFILSVAPGGCLLQARLGLLAGGADNDRGIMTVPEDAPPPPVTIRLRQQGQLNGKILAEESGQPLPGAHLWFDTGVLATADAQGHFELKGLPMRDHELFVLAPGRERIRVLIDTSLRADAQLNLWVPPGGEIRGRVSDSAGNPIPGAVVRRLTSGTGTSLAALKQTCDDQGRFAWDGASFLRPTLLEASAPGFAQARRDGIEVTPGGNPPFIEFRLLSKIQDQNSTNTATAPAPAPATNVGDVRRRTLHGTVLDPNEDPVEGATVRWGATEYEDTRRETRTDQQGRFTLPDVPDGKGYITVFASSFAPAFPSVRNGARQITVRLEPGEAVEGRVHDERGDPIEGVMVVPVLGSPDPRMCGPLWLSECSTRTDAEGKFRILHVPPGARFDFLGDRLSELRNQTLLRGEKENVVALKSTGAIRGRVVDPEGKPVQDFRILLRVNVGCPSTGKGTSGGWFAGYGGPGVTFSSPDGVFVVSRLTVSNYGDVVAEAHGLSQAIAQCVTFEPITGLSQADDLILQLKPALSLRVVTTEPEGEGTKPVDGVRVTLIDGHPSIDTQFQWGYHEGSWNQARRKWTNKKGVATFDTLSFAGATVLVEKTGYGRLHLGWRDRRPEINVTLLPEAIVRGVVRASDGKPIGECQVNLAAKGNSDHYCTVLNPEDEGRFEFRALSGGTYTLQLLHEHYSSDPIEIELAPGETQELTPVFDMPTRFDELKDDVIKKLF